MTHGRLPERDVDTCLHPDPRRLIPTASRSSLEWLPGEAHEVTEIVTLLLAAAPLLGPIVEQGLRESPEQPISEALRNAEVQTT